MTGTQGNLQRFFPLFGMHIGLGETRSLSLLTTFALGAGTMLGPAMIGAGMDVFGDSTMPYLIAAIYAVYLPVFFLARR